MHIPKVCLFLLLAFFAVASADKSGAWAATTDRSNEISLYLKNLETGNTLKRIETLKRITQSGLSDPTLFEVLHHRLRQKQMSDLYNRKHVDELAWMCKALASSGLETYKTTLGEIAVTSPSGKLRHYAGQSLKLVNEYARRNAIMAAATEWPELHPRANRLINLLRAADFKLKRDAAKIITRSDFAEPALYQVVNEELLNEYSTPFSDALTVDTLSWLCKALACSESPKYKATLKEVATNTSSGKLRKYARQSLDLLGY